MTQSLAHVHNVNSHHPNDSNTPSHPHSTIPDGTLGLPAILDLWHENAQLRTMLEEERLHKKKNKDSLNSTFSLPTRDNINGADQVITSPVTATHQHEEHPISGSTPVNDSIGMIRLHDKTILFHSSDVPDPPFRSFGKNIAELDKMWDDTPGLWTGTSPLVIRGTHIPLKYWPEIYKYRRPQQWTGMKQRWHQYHVSLLHFGYIVNFYVFHQRIILEYRHLSEEGFWQKYSKDGERLPFSDIVSMISTSRCKDNVDLVAGVKGLYGDSFERLFRYKCPRRKRWVVMTDANSIARRFFTLIKPSP